MSCTLGCNCTPCSLIHKPTNSWICIVVVICVHSDLIQLPLCNFWQTVLFFVCTSLNRFGARYPGASPSNQPWCQKRALLPLPMVIVVEALKRRQSMSLHGTSVPNKGCGSSPHSCQSHRRHRALPNLSRSDTPMPHNTLGLQTVGQFTRQCPLLAFSSPF